jgi:dihydrofolate reductase
MILILQLEGLWLFKMNLALIAAISDNNVIGVNGKIPWHIPEDLKRFKELTLNHPVIMGRKTYESLPKKFCPLPQRKNIVLSSSLKNQGGIYIARNVEEALRLTEGFDPYIIGGKKVYETFLPHANKLEITRVHRDFEGDTFFPEINWDELSFFESETKVSEHEVISYSFITYYKK